MRITHSLMPKVWPIMTELRSWWTWFVQFVSLRSRYGDVFIRRSGSRGICILIFVMISHNTKWVWNQIQHFLVVFAPEPTVCQIDILGCDHFGGVFEKVLPVWWHGACFHVRYSTKVIVKYYVVLWTNATYIRIPYKYNYSSMEGWVSKIHPKTQMWLQFWLTCSSSIFEPNV